MNGTLPPLFRSPSTKVDAGIKGPVSAERSAIDEVIRVDFTAIELSAFLGEHKDGQPIENVADYTIFLAETWGQIDEVIELGREDIDANAAILTAQTRCGFDIKPGFFVERRVADLELLGREVRPVRKQLRLIRRALGVGDLTADPEEVVDNA